MLIVGQDVEGFHVEVPPGSSTRTHHFSLPESVPTDAQPAVPVADLSRHRGDGPTEGRQADTADVKYVTADRAEG